ncbi:MAG: hypothetical protein JSS65_12005 [Armatimonadetes bacterium]|nr:hypothetical protein [Armatimonadota bacterium]
MLSISVAIAAMLATRIESTGYLVIPVKFADTKSKPALSRKQLEGLFFQRQIGVVDFYKESSYGKFDLSKTVIADEVTLPLAAGQYVSRGQPWERSAKGFFSHQRLADDLSPLICTKYDITKYFGVFIFPNAYDEVPQGGSGIDAKFLASSKSPILEKLAYVEPNTATPCFIVHEIGHHLNLSHVVMEGQKSLTASAMAFIGKSHPEVGTVTCDHIMWQKELLGWISPGECANVNSSGVQKVKLVARTQQGPGIKLVKVRLSPTQVVTAEAVLPFGVDALADLRLYGLLVTVIDEDKCKFENFGQLADECLPSTQISSSQLPVFKTGDQWVSRDRRARIKVDEVGKYSISLTVELS